MADGAVAFAEKMTASETTTWRRGHRQRDEGRRPTRQRHRGEDARGLRRRAGLGSAELGREWAAREKGGLGRKDSARSLFTEILILFLFNKIPEIQMGKRK